MQFKVKPEVRESIIKSVLESIDEANFAVVGQWWSTLNELVDSPASNVFGTLGAWVCAFGIVHDSGLVYRNADGLATDRLDEMKHDLDDYAATLLGLSRHEYDELFEHVAVGLVRDRLSGLLQ